MKRLIPNLLLLMTVIALLLIALYEPGIEQPTEPVRLLRLSADEVEQITINNSLQQSFTLKRDSATTWQMVEPFKVRANRFKVESVLDILQQEPTNRFVLNKEKLKTYGLDRPQVELLFNGKQRLLFGAQTPLNNYRYLQIGNEVLTIKDSAFYPVASRYTNFIASRLLPEEGEIKSIALPDYLIHLSEGGWQLEQKEEGASKAENEQLSGDRLAQWIDNWRYASSVDIEPIVDRADGTNSAESDALNEVEITLQSGEVLRWVIVEQDDGVVLGRADLGIEYHLSDSQREALFSPPPVPQQDETEAKS